jgi:hypothetical protein
MIRSLIVAFGITALAAGLSFNNIGYTTAGENYISKHREQRKSIRPGYYHGGYYAGGARGFRGGK